MKRRYLYIGLGVVSVAIFIFIALRFVINPKADTQTTSTNAPDLTKSTSLIWGTVRSKNGVTPANSIIYFNQVGTHVNADGSYIMKVDDGSAAQQVFVTIDARPTRLANATDSVIYLDYGHNLHYDFVLE